MLSTGGVLKQWVVKFEYDSEALVCRYRVTTKFGLLAPLAYLFRRATELLGSRAGEDES